MTKDDLISRQAAIEALQRQKVRNRQIEEMGRTLGENE